MRGVEEAGLSHALISRVAGPLEAAGPATLGRFGAAVTILSQAVSNVPAVLLFLPSLQALPAGSAHILWLALGAFSTLAGNLTILGSVANLIVSRPRDARGSRWASPVISGRGSRSLF